MLIQFLSHFNRQAVDFHIIKTNRHFEVFKVGVTLYFFGLTVDITCVLDLNLDLFTHSFIGDTRACQRLTFNAN